MSTPATSVEETEKVLPSALASMKEALKHLFGFDLNAILSIGEHEIRSSAEKMAIVAKQKFPADHWVRSTMAERVFAVLCAKIETSGDRQSDTVRAIVEKAIDWADNFAANFYGGKSEDKKAQRPHPDEAEGSHTDLTKKFLESARLRQKRAKPEELKAVSERLLDEARIISQLDTIMTEGEPTETPALVAKVPFLKTDLGKGLKSFWRKTCKLPGRIWQARATESANKKLATWLEQHRAKYGTIEDQAQHDELGYYLQSPLSILGGLAFGFGKDNIWRPWWMKVLFGSAVLALAIGWYWGVHH